MKIYFLSVVVMDVPEGAYGAYVYAPGVGLSMASDYYSGNGNENI